MDRRWASWILVGLSDAIAADLAAAEPLHLVALPAPGQVSLLWQAPGAQVPQFRVEARCTGQAWTVAVRGDMAGFVAVDTDPRLEAGGRILYSLYQLDGEVWTLASEAWADVPASDRIELLGASPNPFNPRTEIVLSVDGSGSIDLAVYDLRGRRVATLCRGPLAAGVQRIVWDGRDEQGREAAAGTYVCRLRVDAVQRSLKLMLAP